MVDVALSYISNVQKGNPIFGMEFYELFENVPDDFNIFRGGGVWMSRGKEEKLVDQKDLRGYLEDGWQIGKLEGDANV